MGEPTSSFFAARDLFFFLLGLTPSFFVVDEMCVAARATPVTEEKQKLLAVYTFRFSKMLDKTT